VRHYASLSVAISTNPSQRGFHFTLSNPKGLETGPKGFAATSLLVPNRKIRNSKCFDLVSVA